MTPMTNLQKIARVSVGALVAGLLVGFATPAVAAPASVQSDPVCGGINGPGDDPRCNITPDALNAAADDAVKEALAARDADRAAHDKWLASHLDALKPTEEYDRARIELGNVTAARDDYYRTTVEPAEREVARLQAIVDAGKMPSNHVNWGPHCNTPNECYLGNDRVDLDGFNKAKRDRAGAQRRLNDARGTAVIHDGYVTAKEDYVEKTRGPAEAAAAQESADREAMQQASENFSLALQKAKDANRAAGRPESSGLTD